MVEYLESLKKILEQGSDRGDRTGVGTRSLFGLQMRFDLERGFPAVTTKKLAWRAVVGELLWFIEGSGDERRLAEITHGTKEGTVTIWTPNALAPYWSLKAKFEGDVGRIYGVQWRSWRAQHTDGQEKIVDQLANLVQSLKEDPYSRRHILTAWNPGELDQMVLPPCHVMSQYYVDRGRLSCQMYQRSADFFLGVPFNIASYALLTHMLAQCTGLGVGELILSVGDAHIYHNHISQVEEQLTREPMPLPTLWLNPEIQDINQFTMDDIRLVGYQSHPPLKAPMAV